MGITQTTMSTLGAICLGVLTIWPFHHFYVLRSRHPKKIEPDCSEDSRKPNTIIQRNDAEYMLIKLAHVGTCGSSGSCGAEVIHAMEKEGRWENSLFLDLTGQH